MPEVLGCVPFSDPADPRTLWDLCSRHPQLPTGGPSPAWLKSLNSIAGAKINHISQLGQRAQEAIFKNIFVDLPMSEVSGGHFASESE